MAVTPSTMIPLGTSCPSFALKDAISAKTFRNTDFIGKPMLVMFICNHCPYVVHMQSELARIGCEYPPRGIEVIGICSNDEVAYPSDSPINMIAMAKNKDGLFHICTIRHKKLREHSMRHAPQIFSSSMRDISWCIAVNSTTADQK